MYHKRVLLFWGAFILVNFTGSIILLILYYQNPLVQHEFFEELMLDKRKGPSETEFFDYIKSELPNLPFEFLQRNADQVLQKNASCAPHPDVFELHYHNDYWQTFTNEHVSFQIYGAYMDNRVNLEEGPMVRILAMISQIDEGLPNTYCQLWFDNRTEPDILPMSQYLPIWYSGWGKGRNVLYPHLLGCVLPEDSKLLIPQAVSLVAEECARATNTLRVNYIKPQVNATKQGFAICVKGLDFPYTDISDRLVEWLEMMRVLGADKIFIYTLQMHPNITKVLNYYEATGFVELTPFILAGIEPNLANFRHLAMKKNHLNKSLNELIPYNDCFYKHMHLYEYIALIDIDEVIMPLGNLSSWRDIVVAAKQSQPSDCANMASVCFRNVYFPNDLSHGLDAIPRHLHMLHHVARVANHSEDGYCIKCLHNTEYVVTLHNHYPMHWQKSCGPQSVNVSQAQLQHYRELHNEEDYKNLVQDANILRFKDELVNRTTRVFSELGFYRKFNSLELLSVHEKAIQDLR